VIASEDFLNIAAAIQSSQNKLQSFFFLRMTTTTPISKSLLLLAGVVLPLTAYAVFQIVQIASSLGFTSPTPIFNDVGCELIPDYIGPGSEDIVTVNDNLALVSAGDLDRMQFKSGKPPRAGGIFAVQMKDGKVIRSSSSSKPLEMVGFPAGRPFNPHGIHYSPSTGRLYAVSHNCGRGEDDDDDVTLLEAVEVFRLVAVVEQEEQQQKNNDGVERENDDETAPPSSWTLVHETSIESDSFPFGSLNGVVEGAFLGEVYVTQWLPFDAPDACADARGPLDMLKLVLTIAFTKSTSIHRCVWRDSETGMKMSVPTCQVTADGFNSVNGITMDPETMTLFVVDGGRKPEIHIFKRNALDGSLQLKDVVGMPYQIDNINFDVTSRKLTMGTIPLDYQAMQRLDGDSSLQVAGGMMTMEILEEEEDGTMYQLDDVLMHDGSKLSQISAGVFLNGKILLGSPPSDGVLACPIPDTTISSMKVQGSMGL
jgi:hypothetical protein